METIILADTDSIFLSKLEWYFIKQDVYSIDSISSQEHMNERFSTPQTAAALVISQDMEVPDLLKHQITHVFYLTEDEDVTMNTGRLNEYIPKYTTSVPAIYNIVTGILKSDPDPVAAVSKKTPTTVILVYSPVGGVGTTSVAVGLFANLYQNYKNVLFLSAEGLQSYASFFPGTYSLMEDYQTDMFKVETEQAVMYLREMARSAVDNDTTRCDFLPPFICPLPSIPLSAKDFVHLLDSIRSESAYEYVIIEADSAYSNEINLLTGSADKVVMVYEDSPRALRKMELLLRSINYSDRNKFIFADNKFMPNEMECDLSTRLRRQRYKVERIEKREDFPECVDDFIDYKGFQNLSNAII